MSSRSSGGPTPTASIRRAGGAAPYLRTADEVVAVFAGAFRAWHGAHLLVEAIAALDAAARSRVHAVFIGDGPELPRVREAAARARLARVTFTGAVPYEQMPAALAAADIGVAPFDVAAHPPLQLAFYWSPLKVFEYMASGRPVVAPRLPRLAALVDDRREGVALRCARRQRPARRAGGARGRRGPAPAPRPGSARARAARLLVARPLRAAGRRVRAAPRRPGARMTPLRVLLATDAFPPICGGSGWSTYELARQLRARGHAVHVVQPTPGSAPGVQTREYDGFTVVEVGSWAPTHAVRAQLREERAPLPAAGRDARRVRARPRHRRRARAARAHHSLCRARTCARRRSGRGHGARLLAGLLLGRPDRRPQRPSTVSCLHGSDDDAVRAAACRVGLAAGAADDSVHAGEPRAQAARTCTRRYC